jgi:RecB family endonuclease NucS
MATLSNDLRQQIISLIQSGESNFLVAKKLDVSPGTVSAIKAHITMGTYSAPSDEETEELIDASETAFGLEKDLQMALRSNIEQLEPGLRIDDGGKEKTTEAGRIDISAKDRNNVKVVIELKAGTAARDALTQLLAYMGAIGTADQTSVRGILVAHDFHPQVVYGARAVPNVRLCQYRFRFSFEPVT